MSRVKWYHYYIVLAMFDVGVIGASLWLHHRTLASFGELLNRAAILDAHQRDLASLMLRLVALNAPGADVFETRAVATERARYQRLRGDLERLRKTGHVSPERLTDFWDEVRRMCTAEEQIFDRMNQVAADGGNPATAASALVEASRFMSLMDRHQAQAMKVLGREQEATMSQTASMLWKQQQILLRYERFEWIIVGALLLAFVGMVWFFWKLQRTDESLQAERHRAEAERRDRLASIGELSASVAHGIQNPLAAIRSSTELILDNEHLDAPSRRRAENVMSECLRLSRRVKGLLSFARWEERARRRVDVGAALRDVGDELKASFQERGVSLEFDIDGPGIPVLADPDALATVFIELLSNALDCSPASESVRAVCRRQNHCAVIEIQDRGPGVSAAAADKVFDLFYTTKPGGTGIGLVSVKRIVESLNGRVELFAAPQGQGTVFRVTLPAADEARA